MNITSFTDKQSTDKFKDLWNKLNMTKLKSETFCMWIWNANTRVTQDVDTNNEDMTKLPYDYKFIKKSLDTPSI